MRPIPTARRTPYSGTSNTLTRTMHTPEKATIAPTSIRPVPGWLATIEDEATVGLGVLHARPLAVATRPGA